MIETLTSVGLLLEGQVTAAFAVFLRMSAFFSLLPAFGERTVPTRIKLGMGLVLTIVVAPAVMFDVQQLNPIAMIFSEIVVGLLLGLAFRLFILALQTTGSIAAQATSLAQLLGGNAAEPMPAIGHVLVIAGLAFAVMTGLHIKAAQFFVLSYELFPAGRFPAAEDVGRWGMQQIASAFKLAFTLAAPFVILSVIYNLTIGAINRAMPQLMVAFVGAPLITAGGLFLLFLTAPLILTAWLNAFDEFLSAPFSGAR